MKINGKSRTPIIAAQSKENNVHGKSGGKKARASRTAKSKLNGVKISVLERIGDGILALDAGLTYTYLNERAGELLGCNADDLIGTSLWQAHPEKEGAPFAEACRRALETQTIVPLNGYFPTSDRWLEGRVYPSTDGVSVLFSEGTRQKKNENRRREERYRILFDSMQEGFLLGEAVLDGNRDAVDGRLLEVNASMASFLGKTREEMVGRTVRDLFDLDDEDLAILKRACRVSLGEEEPFFVERHDPVAGRWLRGHIFSPKQGQFASLLTDITEQKKAEASILDVSKFPGENPNPVLRFTPDGELLYANPASDSLLQAWENQEEHTTPLHEIRELLPSVMEEGRNAEIEVANNGTVYMGLLVPVRDQGYINLYLRDITERKQVEESLRAHINQTNAGITRTDKEGRFTFVNQTFCDMLGYSEYDLIGKSIWEVSHPDDIAKNKRMFERMLREGEPFQLDKRLMRHNGSVLWINVGTSPLRDATGRIYAATSIIVDITRRKRAEESLLDSARRRLYLASLSDTIRPLSDPARIQIEAAGALCTHLKASRVAYVQFEPDGKAIVRGHNPDPDKDTFGAFDLDKLLPSDMLQKLRTGRVVTVSDVDNDPRLDETQKAAHEAMSARAQVLVPLIRDGDLVAALCVQQSGPRDWKTDELSLIEETGERMQAAIERASAEWKLRESEERLRLASQAAKMCTWELNIQEQTYMLGDNFADVVGFPADILPKNSAEVTELLNVKEDLVAVREKLSQAIQTHSELPPLQYRVVNPLTGDILWLEVNAKLAYDHDGKPQRMFGMVQNITERKSVEELLRAKEAELEEIIHHTPFMLARCTRDLRYRFVSRAYAQMIGRTPEEVAGRPIVEVMGQEGLDTILPYVERALRGERVEYESEVSFEDVGAPGLHIVYTPDRDEHGEVVGWFASIVDITERKHAEQSLAEFARQQEALYRLADRLNRTESLGEVFDPALDAILNVLQCERASILLYDDTDVMRFVAWRGLSDAYRQATEGHSPWKPDAKDPEPISISDIRTADLGESLKTVIQQEGIGALAFIPLVSNEKLIGKFMVYFDAPHVFEQDELGFSLTIARQLASSIERKRAEESLRLSEHKFSRLFHFAPYPVALQKLGEARFAEVNGEFIKLFGYSREELIGRTSLEIGMQMDPVKRQHTLKEYEQYGFIRDAEFKVGTKSGGTIWISVNADVVEIAGEKYILSLSQDITDRMKAEQALKASEALYRTIARSIPGGGVYVVDRDFRYMVAEGPVTKAFGLSREMLEGHTVSEVFPDERGARMEERLRRSFTGETVSFETTFNGRVFWTQLAPTIDSIGQVIILTLDITERKQAEEALQQSEERFARFMQHLPGLAWIKDMQGRYVYANAAAEKAFNVPREKLYGRIDEDIFPAEIAAQFRKNDELALADEKGVQVVETLEQVDGVLHSSLVSKFPILGPDGSPAWIGGTAFDITERIRMEKALNVARENAEETASRMARLQKVTAALSESLTPLEVARVVVDQGAPGLGAVNSSMMLLDEDNQMLETVYTSASESIIRPYIRFPISLNVPAADAIRSGQPVWIESKQEYLELYPHLAEQIEKWGHQAGMAIPMAYKGRTLGVLTLSFDRIVTSLEDRGYALTLARQGAQALQRARAESALRESEERYRAIISQATAGIVRKDASGRLIFVNQAFCNMLDQTDAELIGRTMWELTYGEDVAENKRLFNRLMEEGIPFLLEKRLIRRDGSILWANVSVSPVLDVTGKPHSAVSVYVDITKRKLAENRLALLSRISELAREFEEPDELLFAVSREVGEHFRARRALFNEIDVENDREIIHRDYCRGVESLAGEHKISEYSSVTSAEMMAGKTVVNHDSKLDPRTAPDYERSYVRHGERAYVVIPLMHDDRWVASLRVSDDKPREWDKDDVYLLEAVAERTWTAAEKLRVDRALRDSEERLRVTFDTTAVGFATLTPDTRFVDVNDAFCRIVGYSREDLLKMNSYMLAHTNFIDDTRKHMEQLVAGQVPSFTLEQIYVRGDGTEIWVQNSVSIVRDVEGSPLHLIAICQDVTERKRADEELRQLNLELEKRVLNRTAELQSAFEFLRESEATSRLILESMPDAIVITDRDGRIVHANTQVESLFGYSPNEVLGEPVEVLLPERFRKMHIRNRDAYDEQRTRRIMGLGLDLFGLRKDQGEFPVDIMLSPINNNTTWDVMISIRDNTKQRRAQEALRSNEEKLRTLFEILPVGISFLGKDGQITEMNSALTEILGLSKNDLLKGAHRSRRYIRADGTPMPPSEIASHRAISEQKTIYNVETGIVRENGDIIWTSVNAAPVRVADVEAAIVTIDITQRKQAEEAIRKHRERLKILSRRLVEVQEEERRAIARELHDRVGQNLAALILNLNILRNQLSSEMLETVGTRLNDSVNLVKDILTITRSVMADLRPNVLDDYGLDAALNEYADRFTQRTGIRVKTHTPAIPTPRLDAGIEMTLLRIAQEALTNIARHAQADEAVLTLEHLKDSVVMKIEDNGTGILSWQKVNQPGSHGLRIMRERAEAFGGYLKVNSAYKSGTTIEVQIPLGSGIRNKNSQEKRS